MGMVIMVDKSSIIRYKHQAPGMFSWQPGTWCWCAQGAQTPQPRHGNDYYGMPDT